MPRFFAQRQRKTLTRLPDARHTLHSLALLQAQLVTTSVNILA